MKKLFFVLPILAVSLFAFAAPSNYGVTLVEDGSSMDGSYMIASKNSITEGDRRLIIQNVREIYGLEGEGDINVQMRAAGRFSEKTFIQNIRVLSQLDAGVYRDRTTTDAVLTSQETEVLNIVRKYAQ